MERRCFPPDPGDEQMRRLISNVGLSSSPAVIVDLSLISREISIGTVQIRNGNLRNLLNARL